MITIKLVDARKGLYNKCLELFKDLKIAESIYRYLCEGIEECEYAEPERKKGKWIWQGSISEGCWVCSECKHKFYQGYGNENFCPNCGAKMDEEGGDENVEAR